MGSVTAWVCTNIRGDIIVSTVHRTRTGAIQRMTGDEPGWQKRWRHWRRWGTTVERVALLRVEGSNASD